MKNEIKYLHWTSTVHLTTSAPSWRMDAPGLRTVSSEMNFFQPRLLERRSVNQTVTVKTLHNLTATLRFTDQTVAVKSLHHLTQFHYVLRKLRYYIKWLL